MSCSRTFLFLQGPHGPFFRHFARALCAAGHKTIKINFNGGDWVDYPCGISYKHSTKMWPEWIFNFAFHNGVTDLVLYGDCRPLHRIAVLILKCSNIRIHVFEEGYIRPHWVTYELGGVNGNSDLRDRIDQIIEDEDNDKECENDSIPIFHNTRYLIRYCVRYYLFKWLGKLFFRKYKTHRPINSLYEALIWVKRYFSLKLRNKYMSRKASEIARSGYKYYVFMMQLDTDYQVRRHSPYKSIKDALMEVIYSFAHYAPQDTKLVIKNHPLDNGKENYGRLIKDISDELGIVGRLIYLDGGSLPELLDGALGAVTINSTAGLQAIHHRVPLYALGNAVYQSVRLLNQGSLNEFWHNFKKPDHRAYLRFRNYLMRENQVNGSFYDPKGMEVLIEALLKRF